MTVGRGNRLFAETLLAGQRAAPIMSLIQTVKLNGHDPNLYLCDVLRRLPTQRASEIHELLPTPWVQRQPSTPNGRNFSSAA